MEKTQIDPKDVITGNLMAFVYYAKVNNKVSEGWGAEHRLDVTDVDRNAQFQVRGNALIREAYSADVHYKTEHLSKTKVAEILVSAYNRPFTVCFVKDDGTERKLRGRLVQPEPLLGRSMVEDLDLPVPAVDGKGTRLRQVDHRTLKWLIVDGVKYVVK